MFGRPIYIWIILAYLAYGVIAGASSLSGALNGGQHYRLFDLLGGAGGLVLGIWLAAAIWSRSRRMVTIALIGAIFSMVYAGLSYGYVALHADKTHVTAAIILWLAMVGFQLVMLFFVRRYKRTLYER